MVFHGVVYHVCPFSDLKRKYALSCIIWFIKGNAIFFFNKDFI